MEMQAGLLFEGSKVIIRCKGTLLHCRVLILNDCELQIVLFN